MQFPRDKKQKLSIRTRMLRPQLLTLSISIGLGYSTYAATPAPTANLNSLSRIVISVRDQKLMLVQNEAKVAVYPISTSKYGLGDSWGRMTTPLGYMQVAQKIGDNAPVGAVFHNRRFTGEVLPPNAPGRDPITTRIIWLRGLEPQNAHAFSRCIYIHGTNEERFIGRPASFGCIRMKGSDVAALYNQIPLGTIVQIIPDRLPKSGKEPQEETAGMTRPGPKSIRLPSTGSGRGA